MSFQRFTVDAGGWEAAPTAAVDLPFQPDPRVHDVLNEIEFLEQMDRPEDLNEMQWFTLLRDLRHVAEKWLDIALACEWTLLDLFGSPLRLNGRVGLIGVAVLLKGRTIESIDQDQIVIANRLGPPNLFRRPPSGADRRGAELIWHVVSNGEIA